MKFQLLIALVLFTNICLALSPEDTQEINFAAEGAPKHITDEASYLKFVNGKFESIKKGTNNFTCFVVREPKGRYEPSCLNEEAMRSVFPTYELQMNLLYSGLSYEETYKRTELAFKNTQIPTAEVGSLVYMMSPNNKFYNQSTEKLERSPVHQMYYYPKLQDSTFSIKDGPPWLWQGFPHMSALIVVVPGTSP
ncbi:MAG: hypothetical protein ACI9XC_002650 [Gammaproteobacteria bacterium]|jgi:hypothetical protein